MLRRLLEQKRAIVLILSEVTDLPNLSASQWQLAESVVSLLSPFEEVTRNASSRNSSISMVLPSVKVFRTLLTSDTDVQITNSEAGNLRRSLIAALDSRFHDSEYNPIYNKSTLLDPRYKNRCFSLGIVEAVTATLVGQQQTSTNQNEHNPVVIKKPCLDSAFSSCLDSMLLSNPNPPAISQIDKELQSYLAEPLLSREDDPYKWWLNNSSRYPSLSSISRSLLAAPPTTVPSESTFSTAGDIISDHRSSLLPEHAKMLIFLKLNNHFV